MLTRSKIKLEQSIRHTQQDLPYFSSDYQPAPVITYNYSKAQSKASNYQQQHEHYGSGYQEMTSVVSPRQHLPTRNDILKELRQEYEILRNLSVDDTLNPISRNYDHQERPKLSESSISSSVRSKKSNPLRESEMHSPKTSPKEFQSLHLEKKQLEIVIGNSMRKIEELLNNQILLKKTIHELKNQMEGKGGVHQEYEKTMKSLQKGQEDLQEQLNAALHQNQKSAQRLKDQNDKLRQLEGELAAKDRELKQSFDQQRRLHQLIRIQKDKYLNLQIQCKTYKMQFDLLEKEKNSEMNRMIRQFQTKQGGNEKEMAFIIRKLEEEVKEKDKKYHELLVEKEQLKREYREIEPVVDRREKNYLEELMYKSRQMSDTNNRALTDSMNLIIVKMAQLQKKNDETLRREMQALRKKSEDVKRPNNDVDLFAKVVELQKAVDRETMEKARLQQEISRLRDQKYELEDKCKDLEKKWKALQELEKQLRLQIEELQCINGHLNTKFNDFKSLQEEVPLHIQNIKSLQAQIDGHRQYVNSINLSFKEKEKKYEDQIRALKRKVDEAEFETEKTKKEGQFVLTLLKAQHEAQAKRVVDENARLGHKLKQVQEVGTSSRLSIETQLKMKETELSMLKNALQALKLKGQEDLLAQKQFYDAKMLASQNRFGLQIKAFNEKFVSVSSANEKLLSQLSVLSSKEMQLIELRRILKQSTSINNGISHLWQIKEAEYGNINDILTTLKTV